MTKLLVYYIIAINFASYLAFGIDKQKAIHNQWRIPEATLLGLSALGGSAGALLGMSMFRHKIRKLKFRVLVPVMLILHLVVASFLLRNGLNL